MTTAKSPHNANDSFIGYVYQGQYALLLLQDAPPEASISVETDEDVTLEGPTPTLVQLKHSSAERPTSLTVKNAGWWKTLAIWVEHERRAAASFLFITCAPIQPGSPLEILRPQATGAMPDFGALADSLLEEAERVTSERAAVQTADPSKALPYTDKAPGCVAVLAAGRADLLKLLAQITIVDGAVPAAGVEAEVAQRLRGVMPPKYCEPVAKRLMEWWDRRVTLALVGQRDRDIQREEYAEKLCALIQEQSDNHLPDDYSRRQPSNEELAGELRTVMEQQIDLVDGGPGRLNRAARERWRARHQRHRWLEDDISLGPVLDEYDARLLEAWSDQHGPMIDDTSGQNPEAKKRGGQRILDWAHDTAPDKVVPPRPTWRHPFLARGQLQELAEDRQVGWHPDFLAELEKLDGEGES